MVWKRFTEQVNEEFPYLDFAIAGDRDGNCDILHPIVSHSALLTYHTFQKNHNKSTGEKQIFDYFKEDPAAKDWTILHSLNLSDHNLTNQSFIAKQPQKPHEENGRKIIARKLIDTNGFEESILEWVEINDWDQIEPMTNEQKLEFNFKKVLNYIDWQLEQQDMESYRQYLIDAWIILVDTCQKIDRICQTSCATERKHFDLNIAHTKIVGAAVALSEWTKSINELIREGHICRGRQAEWITLAQVENLLPYSKSTIYRWIRNGKLRSNHLNGHQKRISKTSVVLWKHELDLQQFVRERRRQRRNKNKNWWQFYSNPIPTYLLQESVISFCTSCRLRPVTFVCITEHTTNTNRRRLFNYPSV